MKRVRYVGTAQRVLWEPKRIERPREQGGTDTISTDRVRRGDVVEVTDAEADELLAVHPAKVGERDHPLAGQPVRPEWAAIHTGGIAEFEED